MFIIYALSSSNDYFCKGLKKNSEVFKQLDLLWQTYFRDFFIILKINFETKMSWWFVEGANQTTQ